MQRRILLLSGLAALAAGCASDRAGTNPNDPNANDPSRLGGLAGELQRVGDRVLFESDQWELSSEARTVVQRWAQLLRQNSSARVTIEGHADERGTREYNIALGERRAASARSYLVSLGIDANRINPISYGKERPVVTASNPDGWAQNRRAVIVVG